MREDTDAIKKQQTLVFPKPYTLITLVHSHNSTRIAIVLPRLFERLVRLFETNLVCIAVRRV